MHISKRGQVKHDWATYQLVWFLLEKTKDTIIKHETVGLFFLVSPTLSLLLLNQRGRLRGFFDWDYRWRNTLFKRHDIQILLFALPLVTKETKIEQWERALYYSLALQPNTVFFSYSLHTRSLQDLVGSANYKAVNMNLHHRGIKTSLLYFPLNRAAQQKLLHLALILKKSQLLCLFARSEDPQLCCCSCCEHKFFGYMHQNHPPYPK